ncbi:MAG: type IX secretion system membrane protein PorP/SprF [Bacteroidales bacterium]|nr:type IX secretion system membrane protein PorP/SprF [Bacteroidales bacterium]
MLGLRNIGRKMAIVVAVATAFTCSAQVDTQLSQYWALPSYYNPAAIGKTDYLHIMGGTRLQWVGIPNAPTAFLASADMPVKIGKKRIGVGVMFQQESIGLFSNLNAGAQVAYKQKLLGGELSIGVQVGIFDQNFKGSKVYIPDDDEFHQDTDDAIPRNDLHGTAFDMNAGVYYTHKWFWAGISATHLMEPTVSLNTDEGSDEAMYETQAGRMFYFMGGSNIPIKNTLFEIQPSFNVRSDFKSVQPEVTARVRYNKFLSGGVAYRYKDAVSVQLGAEFKNFFVGYNYDYPTSAISKASSGSHEVFVGYNVKLNLGDKNKNKHKSIRIM